MFEIAEDDNKSVFFTSYTTVMSIATSEAWISNSMQMLMQTNSELYNHTINRNSRKLIPTTSLIN